MRVGFAFNQATPVEKDPFPRLSRTMTPVALVGLLIVLALLFVGGPLEARLHRRWSAGRDKVE